MKTVNIALLKAQLSQFLQFVKKGEEVIIYDRNQIVAKIVPHTGETNSIKTIDPTEKVSSFLKKWPKILIEREVDVLSALQEERGDR